MNPLVSIIVPCYNQAQYLSEALQSVLDQTYQNWECIIVNDGSIDNTEKVAKEWIEKDSRIQYLYKENGGLSSARNSGITIANGEFILPLDADDKISGNYLEKCLLEFIKKPNIKIVYGSAIKFGTINSHWNLPVFKYENILYSNMIYCSAVFKKSDWKILGGYDEKMKLGFEDWEFWIRLLNQNSIVVKCEEAVFFYRIKHNSMITNIKSNTNIRKELKEYIYNKHRTKYTILSDFELFEENRFLNKKIDNMHIKQSLNDLVKAFIKKIKKCKK